FKYKLFYVSSIKRIANDYFFHPLLILSLRWPTHSCPTLRAWLGSAGYQRGTKDRSYSLAADTSRIKEVQSRVLLKDKISLSNLTIDKLGPYLAGLWEGDGHISNLKKTENDKLNPYLAITFPIKDLPLVNYLQELLGGSIRRKEKENALVLTIASRKELLTLVQLMNGYLRTPKIFEFNKLIEWLNNCNKLEIVQHSEDNSDLGTNGWLAGFFDADGSFKVRYTEKVVDLNSKKVKRKGRIEVRIAIEQRKFHAKSGKPFEPIMKSISEFFTVKLNTSRHNVDKDYWIIEVTSLFKLDKFVSYLNKYPLLTSKKNDYKDWFIVYSLITLNEHLTKEGKLKIKFIKNQMNRKRSNFDWWKTHLK
uniref:LAGLIDADG endonuclease n=1 Tax=Ramaria rubella TaxID=113071 RepID=UPI0022374E05